MLNGTVEKVEKDHIVLKTDTGHETIELSSNTKGKDQTKVGDRVTINASKKGEKLVASSINASKGSSSNPSPSSLPTNKSSNPPISPGGMDNRPAPGVR
jgi:hypothetical protein